MHPGISGRDISFLHLRLFRTRNNIYASNTNPFRGIAPLNQTTTQKQEQDGSQVNHKALVLPPIISPGRTVKELLLCFSMIVENTCLALCSS